jgi:RNA polymerase sigma factor (sigma-70 family)
LDFSEILKRRVELVTKNRSLTHGILLRVLLCMWQPSLRGFPKSPTFEEFMVSLEDESAENSGKHGWFWTTHWSQVLLARQPDSTQAHEALTKLCQAYWYPLYVFVRRHGHNPEDAQDLVQGYFARLLEKRYLKDADPDKGRFRSYLLMTLSRFMANEWDRANRLKRGGGQEILSLDEADTEHRYQSEPADEMSPERAYKRQWAMTLLEQVLIRLESEFLEADKPRVFAELKVFISGERGQSSYFDVGERLGKTEAAVKVAVHRLRARYRELLRMEIANTVASPDAIEDEIRDLFAAVS